MERLNVVLLKKNLKLINDNLNDDWIPKASSRWIALGHFDEIYIYSVNGNKNFLSRIQEDKLRIFEHSNDKDYYQPLYLVPFCQSVSYGKEVNRFIAIVRVHFPKSLKLTTQFQDISKVISNLLKKNSLPHQIYYATEFSDMVLDVRSNRLDKLLDVVLRLREIEGINIGKQYTYFGINYQFLLSSEEPEFDDKIPYFSMRFSGYNTEIIQQQLKLIKNNLGKEKSLEPTEYCINGIDDIMLVYRKQATSNLINLYRDLFFNDANRNICKPESTSRVGVEIDLENVNYQIFTPDNDLINSSVCAELPSLCQKINEIISTSNYKSYFGWFHTISEVANSLVRMSKTPIMDEVVYLIAPGVHAFLMNILDLLNKQPDRSFSKYGYLYDYVESYSYFIEQLMRIEGQLSHNPEIRPVIYNIPVFMLEYTIAFLNKISNILQNSDADNKLNIVFLLVPRPCELISASEIFSAKKNIPGLVVVQIPENTLYAPSELFRALCHETSHYVGETLRNRSKRKIAYSHAVSALLIDSIFGNNSPVFLRFFKNIFIESLKNIEKPTIREMHRVIINTAKKLLFRKDSMSNLLSKYIDFCHKNSFLPTPVNYLDDNEIKHVFCSSFEPIVGDIDILFREVFADICMMHVLGLPANDYIGSLLQEIEDHSEKNDASVDAFAIRIFVVLTVMKIKIEYIEGKQYIWRQIFQKICKIKNGISDECIYDVELGIPLPAILALLQYAELCYETISTSLLKEDVVEVKQMYSALLNDNFKYQTILKEIESCRENMIK